MGHGGRRKRPDSGSKGVLVSQPSVSLHISASRSLPTPSVSHTVRPNVWFGTVATRSAAAFLPRPAGQLQPQLEPWPRHPSPAPLPPLEPRLTHPESSLPPRRAEAQGPCSPQLSSPASTYFLDASARYLTEKGCPTSPAGAVPGAGWAATTRVSFRDRSSNRVFGFERVCNDVCASMNSSARDKGSGMEDRADSIQRPAASGRPEGCGQWPGASHRSRGTGSRAGAVSAFTREGASQQRGPSDSLLIHVFCS